MNRRTNYHPPRMYYTVEVICAWCNTVVEHKGGMTEPEPTHTICSSCQVKLVKDGITK